MSGGDNRRLKRLRKTKAQLVDELEALERKHAKRKLDADGGKGSGADALLEIEGPFRALLDNSPTAVFVRDVEGRYRFVNRAYEEWYKVDREKILGKTPYDIFKLETADLIIAFHNEVLESGTRIEREVQTILADGSTRSQWAIKFPLMSTDGKTIGVCGILSDLSDKERAEEAIQESEERFRAVVECSPGAIVIRDLEGRNVIANKTFCDWHGIEREDMLGKSAHDFLAKEIADQITAQERKVIETGTIIDEERRVTYPTGVTREIFSQKFPILGPEGDCVAVGTVINDITDRRRAEEANRESEQRLRGAIDSLQEGFALYDADDRLIAFNKKYEHLRPYAQAIMERGGTFEDVLRANIKHEIIPEFVGREEAYVQERLKQHKNPKDPIIRRFKDGTWSMIEEVKTPDGGTAITLIDITEVKKTEEALRKNEALLRAVVDYSPAKIHIKDVEGRYTLINKEAEKLFGITDEEGRGKTSYDLFPKEVADAFMAHDQAVIESGKPTEGEEEFELEDGIHTFLTVKFPIYDLEGVAAVGAIGTDITERKQAEENVRRLANAIEELSENFALYDADDRLIICNESYRNFNWRIKEAITPGTSFEDNIRALVDKGLVAEAKGREEKWIQERIERHRYPSGPFEVARQDGRWLLVREQRMPDGSTVTISTDITERKRVEEALRESEERFRAVIDYSPGVIIIKDLNGRYLITNKMFCDWYRTDIKNILGKTGYDFLTKESADHVTARDRKVVETGTVVEEERRVTYPDGVTRDILAQKFPIFGPDGDCVAVGTVINDITDRKEAEEALKESEDRFRGFAEMSSDWFWEMGPDLRFTYFSPRYAEITGFPIEDRIGSRRSDFIPAEDLEANAEEWAAHLADLEARRPFRNFEYSTTASAEGLRFVRVSGQPAFDADGEFLGYRGTGTDISQRKKAEKDLREAKEQAESASGAKTDFLANMSHELRTPLNSILGFSEILLRETLGPLGIAKYKEYAGDIHASGTHLLGLINEVLDLSKLEAGEFEIDESEIDVVQAVNSCVKMVERRSTGEMASVTAEFADGLPRLLGDEKRLKQILLNLLGNAVKFTPPGGKVKVAARICERGRHTIEVSDNGVGIAEEDISKVLEPFGQARDVHTRDHEGTGLGLYLAKSFTEMHGGTLDIVSGLGKGTTVTLRFPKERTLRIH